MSVEKIAGYSLYWRGIDRGLINAGYREGVSAILANRENVLHVAPVFWENVSPEVHELLNVSETDKIRFRRVNPDSEGNITFKPHCQLLGRTSENVSIPLTEDWDLASFVSIVDDGELYELPILAHLNAQRLKAGSRGHQMYEFLNLTDEPITLPVTDLLSERIS